MLWLTNDENVYNEFLTTVKVAKEESHNSRFQVSESIRTFVELLRDNRGSLASRQTTGTLFSMFDDIGSLWRVNWGEIARHAVDELS
tara:strand:+ start:469 stop:729 length:261 start_codon:yes stop_codon:yes gene_type:complete